MTIGFDYFFFLPEIYWMGCVVVLLLVGTTFWRNLNCNLTEALGYVFCYFIFMLGALLYSFSDVTCSLFNFQCTLDFFVYVFKLVFVAFFFVCLLFFMNYFFLERVFFVEFFFLVGVFVVSAFLLMVSNDFIMFYFSVELQALILYTLAAMKRYTVFSTEGGLKYFVLGALSSGLLLYGISLFYGFCGTTNFFDFSFLLGGFGDGNFVYGIVVATVLVLVGLLFKLAAAPFHVWVPDVYEGSPTPTVLLFAVLPKLSVFVFLLKLFVFGFQFFGFMWYAVFIFVGFVSVVVGTFSALAQFNVKRLYAYSAIVNVGYLLVTLSYGSYESFVAVFGYLPVYFISTFVFFVLILAFRHSMNARKIKFLADYSFFLTYDFGVAFGLAVLFFSFAGIPPLSGFFIKFFLFKAMFVGDFLRNVVFFLVVLFSAVSAFYYISVISLTFFEVGRQPIFFLSADAGYCFVFANGVFFLVLFSLCQPLFYLLVSLLVGGLFL